MNPANLQFMMQLFSLKTLVVQLNCGGPRESDTGISPHIKCYDDKILCKI
jgi:hypothetical protein